MPHADRTDVAFCRIATALFAAWCSSAMARVMHDDRVVTQPTVAAHETHTLEIDGTTVVFEINLLPVPVPRPFLGYRAYSAGQPLSCGVLASVGRYPGSVDEQFTDAELVGLYRTAIELEGTTARHHE